MNFEVWLMFSLAYLITTLSPGPNVILVLKNSIQHGWKSAIITILGNLTCQFFIVCLVAFGVGELLAKLPSWFTVMKIIGGSYLIYLGIKSFKTSPKNKVDLASSKSTRNKSAVKLFIESFLVSASNPKTLIFLSAFLPQFLDLQHSHLEQFSIMYLSICLIVASVHISYSVLMSHLGQKFSFQNIEQKISKLSGGVFITMGGGVLLSEK